VATCAAGIVDPKRNFELIAGKVLHLDGSQHRFAFARNGNSISEFADALLSAGIRLGAPSDSAFGWRCRTMEIAATGRAPGDSHS
jgi:hypothetical protein